MVAVVFNAEERVKKARYKSWVFMGLASISLFFNLLLVLTMWQMGSRLTVMTQLFNTTRGTDTLVLSDILNFNLGDLDVLEKAFVQRFIEERNFQLPDQAEMERRWGPFGVLANISHPDIWSPVYRYDDERIKDVVEALPTHAENIQFISRVGRNWWVSFDLVTHYPNGITKQKRTVTLRVDYYSGRVQKVSTPGFYYNPLGMTVSEYNITNAE